MAIEVRAVAVAARAMLSTIMATSCGVFMFCGMGPEKDLMVRVKQAWHQRFEVG
jgi:hypothetical protein